MLVLTRVAIQFSRVEWDGPVPIRQFHDALCISAVDDEKGRDNFVCIVSR